MYICNCVFNGLLGILKVKIKRRQHLVEKEVEPIFSKDDMKNGPTTEGIFLLCFSTFHVGLISFIVFVLID